MIPENEIISRPHQSISFTKGEIIFKEGDLARYYYQIVSGSVKMFNLGDDGKEFVQGIFKAQQSFGEPPLFGGFDYPASAMSLENTHLYRLLKNDFFKILKAFPETHLKFTKTLSNRLFYKSLILKEVAVQSPKHRILTLLKYLKNKSENKDNEPYTIPHTRKQIAELANLRVETVIRIIKELEKEGTLLIVERKVIL